MVEPEIAFCDLELNMRVAEQMTKAVIEVGGASFKGEAMIW